MIKTFFMHIGKTAGSAVNKMLHSHFGDRFIDHIETKPDWLERIERFDCLSGHFYYGRFKSVVNGRPFRYITVMREPIAQFRSHLNWLRVLGSNPGLRQNTGAHILALSDELADIDLSDACQVKLFLGREEHRLTRIRLLDNGQSRYFLEGYIDRRFGFDDFRAAASALPYFDFVGVSEDAPGIAHGLRNVLETDTDLSLPHANVQKYDREFDRGEWRAALTDWVAYDCALYELARVRAGY